MDNNDLIPIVSEETASAGSSGTYSGNNDLIPTAYNHEQPVVNDKGKAITSMIFGICSVSLWWYPFIFSIPCIVFGIVALVLGNSCKYTVAPRFLPMIKAGKITGIIGLILSIVWTFLFILVIALSINASSSYYYY